MGGGRFPGSEALLGSCRGRLRCASAPVQPRAAPLGGVSSSSTPGLSVSQFPAALLSAIYSQNSTITNSWETILKRQNGRVGASSLGVWGEFLLAQY